MATLVPTPCCGVCVFFQRHVNLRDHFLPLDYGICLRYPPLVEALFVPGTLISWTQRWPAVQDVWVCGEYKEKR